MKSIKIVVATHVKFDMPKDEMYIPLQVGAEGKESLGYVKDNTGANISKQNKNFGTQTALYWIWKNIDSDYKGLVHYRRHFAGKNQIKGDMVASVITSEEIVPMLDNYKVFVPKKRKYYIETLYSHYKHTHDITHFEKTREIIKETCPEYLSAYDRVMRRNWGYMFNMMILQKDLMDDYCNWLFPILFELFKQTDVKNLSAFDSRFCGRVSEILFDVWIERKLEEKIIQPKDIKELPYMEDVNWVFKIKSFLLAKFFNKKYGKSS